MHASKFDVEMPDADRTVDTVSNDVRSLRPATARDTLREAKGPPLSEIAPESRTHDGPVPAEKGPSDRRVAEHAYNDPLPRSPSGRNVPTLSQSTPNRSRGDLSDERRSSQPASIKIRRPQTSPSEAPSAPAGNEHNRDEGRAATYDRIEQPQTTQSFERPQQLRTNSDAYHLL